MTKKDERKYNLPVSVSAKGSTHWQNNENCAGYSRLRDVQVEI